ncbi:MAG TPA: helicase, partial [Kofleriaceae bacterium]|nr:helicase [Kofleriaceae bacterium]
MDDAALKRLQDLIRTRAGAQAWSQGVELARDGAVAGESSNDDEIVVRVAAPGRPVAPTVVLYPADREWDCDCGSRAAACSHAAAAIIAVLDARRGGADLPRSPALAVRVQYRFRRDRTGGDPALVLDRLLVGGESEVPVPHTLALAGAGTGGGALTQADLAIDQLLGTRHRGRLPRDVLEMILPLLTGSDQVQLDGAPVRVADDGLAPLARLEDDPASRGVLLILDRDPATDEVLAPGVARAGTFIHLLQATELTGPRLEALPLRKPYPPPRLGELVADVLPALRARTQLEIATTRLPGIERTLRPRIHFDLTYHPDSLDVLPLLVYGDPPVARID